MKHAIINKWFEAALEGSNVVSFILDEDLRYIAVVNPLVLGNESFFVGRTPREIFGELPGGAEMCDAYERVHATGVTARFETLVDNIWFEITLKQTQLPNEKMGVLGTAIDITRQKILLRDQAHRTKNAFSMAMAMANHTARGMDVPQTFKTKLHERLDALSKSQDAVYRNGGCGADFHSLVQNQIGHAIDADPERFKISADACFIDAELSQYVTLAIYELYTNAVKYGALSNDTGVIILKCTNKEGALDIVWEERGGPPPSDDKTGFGRMLVTSMIPKVAKGVAMFNLRPEGLHWALHIPQFSPALCDEQ